MAWRRQRRHKCRPHMRSGLPLVLALLAVLLTGCAAPGTGATSTVGAAPARPHASAYTTTATNIASLLPATPTATPPPPGPATTAAALILVNPDTGTVYAAVNADQQRAMASTTKIMTAVVALTLGNLNKRITVGPDLAQLAGTGASVAFLHVGDSLTLHDLLYALMLPSGDDAAIVIADGVAGSQDNYIRLMNFEAALLGMRHTHFADVHGLDATGHYTSARDLATLTEFALRNPTFAQIVATAHYTLPATAGHAAYSWDNTNLLLSSDHYPGITGVKTGFTGNAGECLVFAAARPYGRLVGVVLGEPNAQARFSDAAALLDWGFALEKRTATHQPITHPS